MHAEGISARNVTSTWSDQTDFLVSIKVICSRTVALAQWQSTCITRRSPVGHSKDKQNTTLLYSPFQDSPSCADFWVEIATHGTIKNNEWTNEPSVCLTSSRKWQHLGQQQSELREVQIYMKYKCPQKETCMVREGFVCLFVWSNLLRIPRDRKGGVRKVPVVLRKSCSFPWQNLHKNEEHQLQADPT